MPAYGNFACSIFRLAFSALKLELSVAEILLYLTALVDGQYGSHWITSTLRITPLDVWCFATIQYQNLRRGSCGRVQ